MEKSEIIKKLKSMLPEKRMDHTWGVAYTASCLAYRYGEDPGKAHLAGLLHDCAKYVPAEQKIRECREAGYEPGESEMVNPELLHARLGAIYADRYFGVSDPEVLSAITWHTTGRPAMTLLDKIIYIADYIEPNRDRSPILKDVRAMAFCDIDRALLMIMDGMMDYLGKGKKVDPMTEQAWNYYNSGREL